MEPLKDYFPEIEPFQTEFLKVSDLHHVYVEQCGNPNGRPVLFLHGGPGGGVLPYHRQFFDAKFYRIILFDQRGSGKSTPAAELKDNTTWDLVNDIEKIRAHLNIKDWIVFGGSWGSTLALAYAITHPEKVKGLILRGIFLTRPSEIKWFYQEGASQIFPDAWEKYFNYIPAAERNDFVTAYYKRLTSDHADTRLEAARIWSQWEAATSRLHVDSQSIKDFEEPTLALQFARIECHYFINHSFFKTDNYLLENISKIKQIPATIIQGRYDVVCPVRSAWDLHRAWPEAKLNIIADAGHSAGEPGIRSALIDATEAFKTY
ncbi:MAG: prolyl aminopeptidase [Bdellovibrio sp.]|nr:prolyl aminopeptidase [Bdellovibrio sp.]